MDWICDNSRNQKSFMNVPLCRTYLESNLVSNTIEVGVVSSLPMRGIFMLLGNDLAHGKIIPHPRVVAEPSILEKTEKIGERYPGVFPLCMITWAEAQKRAEGKRTKEGNDNERNKVIDLCQMCLGHKVELNLTLKNPPWYKNVAIGSKSLMIFQLHRNQSQMSREKIMKTPCGNLWHLAQSNWYSVIQYVVSFQC